MPTDPRYAQLRAGPSRSAREAASELGRPETAVAFSVWPEPLSPAFTRELAGSLVEASPDLILAETVEKDTRPTYGSRTSSCCSRPGCPSGSRFRWTVDGPP